MFWDYCPERQAAITNMTQKNLFQIQVQHAHMAAFGWQGDISIICQFNCYELIYERYGYEPFPHMSEFLGHCLGPANN